MQRNTGSLRLNEDYSFQVQHGFTCDECGKTFEKPVLATVSSCGDVQKYYACPYCIAKVGNIKTETEEERPELAAPRKSEREGTVEKSDQDANVSCKRFLGYLKKRPKDTSIPDECLTCDKMIDCLA